MQKGEGHRATVGHRYPPRSPSRRDEALESWCHRLWQTQPGAGSGYLYEHWPSVATFKAEWPLLAEDLIVADWDVELAAAGSEVAEGDLDLINPPPPPVRDWRSIYRPELDGHAGLAWDLVQENPVAKVATRAKLTPLELDVLRLWATGDSLSSISRTLGRQKRTVDTLLERIRYKLAALRKRSVDPRLLGKQEDPCLPPSLPSPTPGSSSMRAAS